MTSPVRAPFRLVTSRTDAGNDKCVSVEAGATLELCRVDGAGRIARLWMTLPLIGQRWALKDTVIRMYWDGEEDPSVEAPLGDFFGATFGRPRRLVSSRLVVEGGAYVCRFEMPFNAGAIIEIENQASRTLRQLFFQIGYYEEPQPKTPRATLHCQYRRFNPTIPDTPCVLLSAEGAGWLGGIKVDFQNLDWWLKPPLRDIPLPRGFGLGLLEGWETITVDGDEANGLSGTGAEDYFSGGFYFKGAPFCTPTHGCTLRSFLSGRASAYRFHVDDPIYFNSSLKVVIDHGLNNSMKGDYTSVAFWYQLEPHRTLEALPTPHQRRPRAPLINPLQWWLVVLVAAAIICAAGYGLASL